MYSTHLIGHFATVGPFKVFVLRQFTAKPVDDLRRIIQLIANVGYNESVKGNGNHFTNMFLYFVYMK